jgi:hypothetical protein
VDDADAVGVGLTAGRFAEWTPRFAEAPGGTLATWNGCPAHNPTAAVIPEAGTPETGAPEAGTPEAGAQVAGGVCRAVTFPGTGEGAGPEPRAR